MKNLKTLFTAVALGVLAAGASSVQAQQSKPGFATAIRTQGVVTYTLGDGKWYPLVPGKTLPPGSSVRTGDNGTVDVILGKAIQLPTAKWTPDRIAQAPDAPVRGMVTYKPSAEQNMVRLVPNSTLAIDRLNTTDTGADTVSDTELDLKEGQIYASVKKLSGASQYLVKIPNGVAGVRGTWFSLGSDGGVAVYESANGGLLMAVTYHGQTFTVQVNEGQMFVVGNNSGGTGGGSQPATVPIPPALQQELKKIFDAVKTTYTPENIQFAEDKTATTHVSATAGLGSGGSGGNGGNGGGTPAPN
jgi:FecR protein